MVTRLMRALRIGGALIAASLLLPISEAVFVFFLSGATRDRLGNFEIGHVHKWAEILSGPLFFLTEGFLVVYWLILFGVVRLAGQVTSKNIVLSGAALGLAFGCALLALVWQDPMASLAYQAVVIIPAVTFALAMTAVVFCAFAGIRWEADRHTA